MATVKKSFSKKIGRPLATNLKYFGLDIDFDNDPKFVMAEELIRDRGGTDMECILITKIAIRILSYIYANGYYAKMDNTFIFTVSKSLHHFGVNSSAVRRIIEALIDAEFLHRPFIEKYNILTSKGIQTRWWQAIKNMHRDAKIDPLHNLIDPAVVLSSKQSILPSEQSIVNEVNKGTSLGVSSAYTIEDIKGNGDGTPLLHSYNQSGRMENQNGQSSPSPQAQGPEQTPFARPPLLDNARVELVEFSQLRPVAECMELYFSEQRCALNRDHTMRQCFNLEYEGYENLEQWEGLLRRWGEQYRIWLEMSGKEEKTMDDILKHFKSWLMKNIKKTLIPEDIHITTNEINHGTQGTKPARVREQKIAGIDESKVRNFRKMEFKLPRPER